MRKARTLPQTEEELYYHIISEIDLVERTEKLINKLNAVKEDDFGVGYTRTYRDINHNLVRKILQKMIELNLSYTQFESLYNNIFKYLEKQKDTYILPSDLEKKVNKLNKFLLANI